MYQFKKKKSCKITKVVPQLVLFIFLYSCLRGKTPLFVPLVCQLVNCATKRLPGLPVTGAVTAGKPLVDFIGPSENNGFYIQAPLSSTS